MNIPDKQLEELGSKMYFPLWILQHWISYTEYIIAYSSTNLTE